MKNFVFIFIMILSLGTVEAFADDKSTTELEMTLSADKYTSIDVKDLPEDIQAVLAMDYSYCTVSSADAKSVGKGEIVFKVTLLDQENMEETVLLSEKGEILE